MSNGKAIGLTRSSATSLMREYTKKLQKGCWRLRDFREKFLAAKEKRMQEVKDTPSNGKLQQIWTEKVPSFQATYNQKCTFLRNLTPPTKKLAQHISQKISHGGLVDLKKIEMSLRLAELESAISETEEMLRVPPPQFFW